jgi:hypothetical protein
MRFFTEQTGVHEGFAETAGASGFGIELHSDQQALAPDFLDVTALDRFQLGHEIPAHLGRVRNQLFLLEDTEGLPGNGAGERITAERRAVFARLEDGHDIGRRQEMG